MDIANVFDWFWPVLAFLLLILWLWTLLRQRRERPPVQSSISGSAHERIEAEDMLKAAYVQQKKEGRLNVSDLARALGLSEALTEQGMDALVAFGWVEKRAQGGMRLTEKGEAHAQDLIRAHRLWERYLVDREGMALDAVHAEAHRREHTTTPEELERLDAELGHPAWGPHGHAIPGPSCQVPSSPGRPLSEEGEPGDRLRIVCLDEEPVPLLAQLVALGLKPGVDVEIVDREPGLLRLQVNGVVVPLASAAARHVYAVAEPRLPLELGRLPVGARARVVEITGGGTHQRRMLDMGFVPGAEVTVLRKASLGDPIEYRIKGTGIAMRRTDANSVMVEEVEDG
ncbi:MAG: FeoA domain-containing protein [Chloroflexota bacterium]|nr:FeoA domain-containing protein [Chloroflexota bacterium]